MENEGKIINRKSPKKISFRLSIILLILVFLAAFIIGLMIGSLPKGQSLIKGINPQATSTFGVLQNIDGKIPEYLTKDVDFDLFWEVWGLVKDKYYEKDIAETQLFYGALSGLVASLGDPYSVFMTPQDSSDFQEEMNGNFEGIGAEIGIRDKQLTIISPLPDSPAMAAGLRAKDLVLKIDGVATNDMSLDKAVSLIRGKKGTTVALTIFRGGFDEPQDFSIIRDTITVKSLTLEFKDNNIAYLKIRQFNDETLSLFNQAIIDINSRREVKGIILDLRNNPGGLMQSAIDVADKWLDEEVIVREKRRDGTEYKYNGSGQADLAGYKTVVLVNLGSASGSEIVAGALQDWGKAKIVGEKTFGKGSVQELSELEDGSSVKITVAKWFTPQGRSIEDEGIEPDIAVEMTEEDYDNYRDPQLDKAMELLNQ